MATQIPAALILLAGGLLACFAGYRLFRLVLGIYGFILGALLATSIVSPATALSTAIVVLVGGVIGAVVLTAAYFLGVALLGVGLGVLIAETIWSQQGWGTPDLVPLFVLAVIGAAAALIFQRYVIIVATAFGGAWTALMGLAATLSREAATQVADPHNVWIVNPLSPPLTQPWITLAWLALGIVGVIVQLRAAVRRPT